MTQLLKGVRETITVPIPKGRTYFSPKQRNGYKNQIICTDDLDCEQNVGEFAGYSIEFAYSKVFLKYVMTPMESDKFGITFKGIDGVTNFSGEIYRICQFLKQDEMYCVRSINRADFPVGNIDIPESYWVNHIEIVSSYNPNDYSYNVGYVEDERQYPSILYSKASDLEMSWKDGPYGVRPVIYLPLPKNISKNDAWDLVSESFVWGK